MSRRRLTRDQVAELAESLINGNRGVVREAIRKSLDPAQATAMLALSLMLRFGVDPDHVVRDVDSLFSV